MNSEITKRSPAAKKKSKRGPAALIAAATILLCFIIWYCVEQKPFSAPRYSLTEGCAEVHFIDVGQGDCALIRTKTDTILIDAGTNGSEADVRMYLDALGIGRFTLCVFTHPDEDHIGAADMILSRYGVDKIILPQGVDASNSAAVRLADAAEKAGATTETVSGGETFTVGHLQLRILSAGGKEGVNDSSVVLLLTCGDVSMLFQGDAESATEQKLLADPNINIPTCSLLKVAHHGAMTATTDAWLDAICPQYAVISCGAFNSYGHPHAMTLRRLAGHGAEVHRTDTEGSIVFFTDGKDLIIKK